MKIPAEAGIFGKNNAAITYSRLATTIGAGGLNFRVRNENGCDPTAEAPAQNAQSCCTAYADTTNTAFCSSNLKRVTQKS